MQTTVSAALAALALLAVISSCFGDVKPNPLFADHMVLQRDKDIPVYGTAAPGEKVEVKFQDKTASAEADQDGNWKVKLGKFAAGGPYEMTIKGASTIAIKDIMVGDVWVCCGQSNMAWGVGGCVNGPKELAEANYPGIRFFNSAITPAGKPQPEIRIGGWTVCTPARRTTGRRWATFCARDSQEDQGSHRRAEFLVRGQLRRGMDESLGVRRPPDCALWQEVPREL